MFLSRFRYFALPPTPFDVFSPEGSEYRAEVSNPYAFFLYSASFRIAGLSTNPAPLRRARSELPCCLQRLSALSLPRETVILFRGRYALPHLCRKVGKSVTFEDKRWRASISSRYRSIVSDTSPEGATFRFPWWIDTFTQFSAFPARCLHRATRGRRFRGRSFDRRAQSGRCFVSS